MENDIYVVAEGKALSTLRGILGPGEEVKEEDIKTKSNFEALIRRGKIIEKQNYKDNEDSQFRAPEKKAKNKKEPEPEKTKQETSQGAKKK